MTSLIIPISVLMMVGRGKVILASAAELRNKSYNWRPLFWLVHPGMRRLHQMGALQTSLGSEHVFTCMCMYFE